MTIGSMLRAIFKDRSPSLARQSKKFLLRAGAAALLALVAGSTAASALNNSGGTSNTVSNPQQNSTISVESLSFRGTPDGDVYVTGEDIDIQVEFSVMPTSWSPSAPPTLKLQVGSNERTVNGGFDGETAYFTYTVVDADLDTDGVSVNANSLGGNIEVNYATVDLSTVTHDAVNGGQAHRVSHPQPTISSIAFDGTPSGTVYETGDSISVELEFSAAVTRHASDPMTLALQVGDNERAMTSSYSGSTVTMAYTVKATDYDTDGLSVNSDSLDGQVKVGSVTFDASDISHAALSGGTTHQVNRAPPTVEAIAFDSTPADTIYLTGEEISVEVEFSETIAADSGNPLTLKLQVGSNERTMTATIDDDTATFSYTVQSSDSDTDGVSVVANSLGGRIVVDSITLAASLIDNDAVDGGDDHRVNPPPPTIDAIEIVSSPSGDVYAAGETISVEVEFDANVEGDSSDPLKITLQVGDNQRSATGIFEGRFIYFQYRVRAADLDTDGVSVVANSMTGTLTYGSVSYDGSDITLAALDGGDGHKVNRVAPTLVSISYQGTPDEGDTYLTSELISVVVEFGETVDGDSSDPLTLELQVGNRVRTMSGSFDGAEAYLAYEVQASDYDADGVSVIANSLAGTVKVGSFSWDASTSYSHDAVDGGADHKVNPPAISVNHIIFRETPSDRIYDTGEEINLEVKFSVTPTLDSNDPVTLDLQVGDNVRTLTGGFESDYAYFWYEVQDSDYDGDGVSVNANALNGTLIVGGNTIDAADLEHDAVLGGLSRLVNRPDPLKLESVAITSAPSDGEYDLDDVITVKATFNQVVTAGDEDVTLLLSVGGTERTMAASYDGTASVLFTYQVQQSDYDADGIDVVANSMSGDIAFGGGGHTVDTSTMSFSAIAGGQDHRVRELVLESLAIVSDPGSDGAYLTGDIIKIRAIFNRHVTLHQQFPSHFPMLQVDIGSDEVLLGLKSGGEGIADFQHVVVAANVDNDGISIPENPFSGDFWLRGSHRVSTDIISHAGLSSNHQVNPDPDIDSIEITSDPPQTKGYTSGDLIKVTVTFFEPVIIGGTRSDEPPTLNLTLHGVDNDDSEVNEDSVTVQAIADVDHGAEVTEIDFVYVVQHTDLALDGISIPANSIAVNDSPITQASDGEIASVLHSAVDRDASQVLDPRLRIVSITFSSEPDADSFYGVDDEIRVKVVFDEDAQLANADTPTPTSLSATDHTQSDSTVSRTFVYESGSFSDIWSFVSTVEEGDDSYNGITLDAIDEDDDLNELINASSGADVLLTFDGLIDTSQLAYGGPMASAVTVTSTPNASDSYSSSETFTFEVSFDNDQLIIEVDPEIDLQVGSNVRVAKLVEGHGYAGPRKLRYEYEFTDDDIDADGIEILDTWFLVDGDFTRGYFQTGDTSDSSTFSQVIWKFVNPSPGALSDHKVQSGSVREMPSSGLSWLPD